jgi:lysozyme family protein
VSIDAVINGILDREGDAYTNDPKDSGGPTKYGVTQATLSRYRALQVTPEQVERLTRPEAFNVYNWLYVIKPGFDKVVSLAPAIGEELIDLGVLAGPAIAALILQRLLNVFNNESGLYGDIKADGDCGPSTIAALRAFLDLRGDEGLVILLRGIRALKVARFVDIAEHRPKDERFVYGWIKQRGAIAA